LLRLLLQSATAAAHDAGLVVVLLVSADESDAFVVSLFEAQSRSRSRRRAWKA